MEWHIPIDKNEFVKMESVNRQLKKARSTKTQENWKQSLYLFFKFIRINPDEFVKLDKTKIEDLIEFYVDHLKKRVAKTELNPNSVGSLVVPLVKFLTFNRVDGMHEAWSRIRANFPEKIRSHDEKYDEIQICKMYQFANIREKAILGLLMSGMRVGAMKDLKVMDLRPVEDWASIAVYAGTNSEYHTFVTPQGYKDIMDYLDYRRRNGEVITQNSSLIRREFQPEKAGEWVDSSRRKHGPKPISTTLGFTQIVIKILRTAGVTENSHNPRFRHKTMACHGFRKYVNTICKTSGMDSERVDMLLGHSNSSLAGHYWRLPLDELDMTPQELRLFQTILAEYRRCIPELTIGESEIIKLKNQQLHETINGELKQKEIEIVELHRQLQKIKENPFMGIPQEKVEEYINMFEDWKVLKQQLSDSHDLKTT